LQHGVLSFAMEMAVIFALFGNPWKDGFVNPVRFIYDAFQDSVEDLSDQLMVASHGGNLEEVQELIAKCTERKAAVSCVTWLEPESQVTSLMWATEKGHTEVVAALLAAGASENINHREPAVGSTALLTAAFRGRVEIARMLLEAGADPDQANAEGETPWGVAMQQKDRYGTDVSELLLSFGAVASTSSSDVSDDDDDSMPPPLATATTIDTHDEF